MMASFGMLTASSRRSAPLIAQSITSKSHLAPLSLFSTASSPAAATKKPSPPGNNYGRFVLPTTMIPPSSPTPNNAVWRTALQNLQKTQKEEMNNLQWIMDKLRIARLPTNNTPTSTTTVVVPKQPSQQQHTFQVMNRNARKPKRANHGKRPCSRIRRRFKIKKWANTSRRG
ncbi:hypothetical protein ACHAXR_005964 [Thalassiosira sp. AJA248-18]